MHNIKVGDTVRIAYCGVRDDMLLECIFNEEICTVTDIYGVTAIVTSEAIRKYMHEEGIDRTDIGCNLKYLIPVIIEEEDIDTTYDVLV